MECWTIQLTAGAIVYAIAVAVVIRLLLRSEERKQDMNQEIIRVWYCVHVNQACQHKAIVDAQREQGAEETGDSCGLCRAGNTVDCRGKCLVELANLPTA